jgi:hypothetical protein
VKRVASEKVIRHFWRILTSPGQRKHLLRWLRSRRPDYVLDAAVPWLTFNAIDELRRRLPPNAVVFEYGSGGSTLFWLKHRAHCTSVEHDARWFALVRQRVGSNARHDYRLVPPDAEQPARTDQDAADPKAYRSIDAAFRQHTFKAYARQIDEFPNGHFDVVLVDGRARPSCLMHAAPKVKRGGLLILDNAERDYYTAQAKSYLRDFERAEFFGAGPSVNAMWRTDIYGRQN